jgi:HK97 family phage prohead protease
MPETERQPILRTFATDLELDGRTVVGMVVPYGEIADVSDGGPIYREAFVQGAFTRASRAPQHVILDVEHSELVQNSVGVGHRFEDTRDGLRGFFRMLEVPAADTALALVRAGTLDGLSVEAVPLGPGRRGAAGELLRTACHLRKVALCRADDAAYRGARVEAVRTNDGTRRPPELEALRPVPPEGLDERIAAYRDRTA